MYVICIKIFWVSSRRCATTNRALPTEPTAAPASLSIITSRIVVSIGYLKELGANPTMN